MAVAQQQQGGEATGLPAVREQLQDEPYAEVTHSETDGVVVVKIGGVPAVGHAEQRARETVNAALQAGDEGGFEVSIVRRPDSEYPTIRIYDADADSRGGA